MANHTQRPGDGERAQRVRDAVVEVLRDARDARRELTAALILHAWARVAERGPHPFAIVAYGARAARYVDVAVDAFEVELVGSQLLDAALDALLATPRPIAAALVAVPCRAGVGELMRELRPALAWEGMPPCAMHARVVDGPARSSHLLLDDRCPGAGCSAAVERRGDRLCLVDGAPPAPLPESFVAALSGFPWARASERSAFDQNTGRPGPASARRGI